MQVMLCGGFLWPSETEDRSCGGGLTLWRDRSRDCPRGLIPVRQLLFDQRSGYLHPARSQILVLFPDGAPEAVLPAAFYVLRPRAKSSHTRAQGTGRICWTNP